jgi:hypothetical protein
MDEACLSTTRMLPHNQCSLCQNVLPAGRVFPVTGASMDDGIRKPEWGLDHVGKFRIQWVLKKDTIY